MLTMMAATLSSGVLSVQDRPSVRFSTFPRTQNPPDFLAEVIEIFNDSLRDISTVSRKKGLTSDGVLQILRQGLVNLGFEIEAGKRAKDKIRRPVFFGENARPSLQYEVDGYHPKWRAGLEVEAGRAWMGNAVYRDLIQALVMVDLDHLILAVPIQYKYRSGGRVVVSKDFDKTVLVADALYGHSRVSLPFTLSVIGY